MPEFIVQYSRRYERSVEAEDLTTAAERAKKVCDNTTDCRLIAVWALPEPRPNELMP